MNDLWLAAVFLAAPLLWAAAGISVWRRGEERAVRGQRETAVPSTPLHREAVARSGSRRWS